MTLIVIGTTHSMEESKFEKDLKAYFPKIYKLHQLGKWDKFLWDLIYQMEDLATENAFAEIKIIYQMGRINNVYVTRKMTSREVQKDGFAVGDKDKKSEEEKKLDTEPEENKV